MLVVVVCCVYVVGCVVFAGVVGCLLSGLLRVVNCLSLAVGC